jgi:hypothetical protein
MRRRIAATRRLHGLRTRCSASATAARDPESGAPARPTPGSARRTSPGNARTLPARAPDRFRADPADPDADADPPCGPGLRTRGTAGAHPDSRPTPGHQRARPPEGFPPDTCAWGSRLDRPHQPSDDLDKCTGDAGDRLAGFRSPKARAHPHRHDAVVAKGAKSDGSRCCVSGSVVSFDSRLRGPRAPSSTRDELACHSRSADPDGRAHRATGDVGTGALDLELHARCSGACIR